MSTRRAERWFGALLLTALSLLLGGCSCPESPVVTGISVVDGVVYAEVLGAESASSQVYASADGGRTWTSAEPVAGAQPACDRSGLVCFQNDATTITKTGSDGVPEVVWRVPTERRDFVTALAECGGALSMELEGPVVVTEPPAGSPVGIVSMGDQGVVVVSADGAVRRVGVGGAIPTPFTKGFDGYTIEFLLMAGGAIALFWLLSALTAMVTIPARRDGRGTTAIILGAVAPATAALLSLAEPSATALLALLLPVGLGVAWSSVRKAVQPAAGKLASLAIGGAVGVLLVAVVPWELWARGVIDSRDLAVRFSSIGAVVAGLALVAAQSNRSAAAARAALAGGPGAEASPPTD